MNCPYLSSNMMPVYSIVAPNNGDDRDDRKIKKMANRDMTCGFIDIFPLDI